VAELEALDAARVEAVEALVTVMRDLVRGAHRHRVGLESFGVMVAGGWGLPRRLTAGELNDSELMRRSLSDAQHAVMVWARRVGDVGAWLADLEATTLKVDHDRPRVAA
jgi:hypothetical protein